MQITKYKTLVATLVVAILMTTIYFTVLAQQGNSNAPPVLVAQYKVEVAGGDTYYGVAYGIKADGTLRFEAIYYNPDVVELGENYLPAASSTRLIEIPAGKWELIDRLAEKKITRED